MFALNESLTYYLYPGYVSMNKGLECLYELIRSGMGVNPLTGDVFLFFGKKRDTVKILRFPIDIPGARGVAVSHKVDHFPATVAYGKYPTVIEHGKISCR